MPKWRRSFMTCSVSSRWPLSPEAPGFSSKNRCFHICQRMNAWQGSQFSRPAEQSSSSTREIGKLYSEDFTADEKKKIVGSLNKAVGAAGFTVEKTWGETIEDRGSQITYSALGQQAPLEEKEKWDSDVAKRKKIKKILDTLIPEFSVRIGGSTSIDVTKPGIDKAYGIRKLRDILGIPVKEMIYVGDALLREETTIRPNRQASSPSQLKAQKRPSE